MQTHLIRMAEVQPVVLREISRITLDLRSSLAGGRTTRHPHHEILVPIRGVYRCRIGKMDLTVPPGQMLFLPEGTENRVSNDFRGETALYLLRWDGAPLADRPIVLEDRNGRLPWACAWLRDLHGAGTPRSRLHRLARLIVEECRDLWLTDRQPRDAFDQVDRFIDANLAGNDIDIDDLRRVINVSRTTLYRLFAQRVGTTPMRYLRERRLERAVELVRRTRLPLNEIAARVGIASTTHLSNLIARHTGRRPREWRLLARVHPRRMIRLTGEIPDPVETPN